MVPCQFCKADIRKDSIRCKHCGEIVNEDYYRQRAQRIRARVNYASWVAYLFGLAALLVFRPVGLLSVAAGLLLSIVYYAIPVEPPSIAGRKKISLSERLRRQMKFERVAIPIPHFKSKKLIFVGTPLVAALIGYSANTFLLQEPMNQVLKENSAFNGMHVRAHYEYWIVPGVVVYDLRDLSVRQTPIDVHTAFLEFAQKLRDRKFTRVQLSYRGNTRFEIDGASFRQLGNEYAKRNFDYVLYKFPQLFQPTQPSQINKTDSARDALVQFHREWYGRDLLTRTVANGL
jgi:predicted nucleic acid-binding Zn ribbon protein